MSEINDNPHIKVFKGIVDIDEENLVGTSEEEKGKILEIGAENEQERAIGEEKVELFSKDGESNGLIINGKNSEQGDTNPAGKGDTKLDQKTKKTAEGIESSNDNAKAMAKNGQNLQGAVIITSAPVATAGPKPKPKLERRKSLNPRVMTPPGLEVLDNIQLLAIRQQMEMDIHSRWLFHILTLLLLLLLLFYI
jgi:hypothetical protein